MKEDRRRRQIIMKTPRLVYLTLFVGMWATAAETQAPKYPPIEQYLMHQADEIALAKTAGPTNISDRATIKVLTKSGYEVAQQGDNGSVCMVMRSFSAPTYSPVQFRNLVYDATVLAPICFTPASARTAMPYYELRTKLALQAKARMRLPQVWRQLIEGASSRREMR